MARPGDLAVEPLRQGAAGRVEGGADLGGDGEAGGHRQPDGRHLREAGPLAAQQLLQPAVPIRLAAAERIDALRHPHG
jgi:hypothetical protein